MVRSNLLGAEMNANELMPQLKELKDEILKLIEITNRQQTEIEYWKSAFERAMGIKE